MGDYCGFAVFASSSEGFKSLHQHKSQHSHRMLLSLPCGLIAFSSHFFYLFLIICLVLWASMCLSLQVDCELSEDWIWSLLFVTPQYLKQFFTKCALCVCGISVVLKELLGGMSPIVPLFYLVETERHRGLISSSWLGDLCSSLTSAGCLFYCALLFLSWSWFSYNGGV